MKNIIISLIVVLGLFSCKKEDKRTGIEEIDKEYQFKYKHITEEDSLYPQMQLFCNNTLNDSIYTVGLKSNKDYKLRIRGWGFNKKRIGDWYYEKVYKSGMIVTDSVVNYIVSCDKNPRNTIKKFKNNKLDRTKGYFYEMDMNKNVSVGDTLVIKLNFSYDTLAYENVGRELYIFKPLDFYNVCDALESVVDSFPILENKARMRLLMSEEDKGKNRYLGYYYLVPRKQKKKDTFTVMQVFTEINFVVK